MISGSKVFGIGGIHSGSKVVDDTEQQIVFMSHPESGRCISGQEGTFSRATAATVIDHENVIREVNAGELRYQGYRRVENLINLTSGNSEDFSNWTLSNTYAPTLVDTPYGTYNKIAATGVTDPYISLNIPAGEAMAEKDIIFQVKLFTDAGQPTNCNLFLLNSLFALGKTQAITITNEPKTYYMHYKFPAGDVGTTFNIRIDLPEASVDGGYIYAQFAMAQDKTGSSTPTIPDSYVSKGVGVGAEIVSSPDLEGVYNSGIHEDWHASGSPTSVSEEAGITGSAQGVIGDSGNLVQNTITLVAGKNYNISGWIKVAGGGTVTLRMVTGFASNFNVGETSSADWIYVSAIAIATATTTFMRLYTDGVNLGVIDNISIQEIPDHGSNVDGVKCFLSENGNTVTDNVITHNSGRVLDFTRNATNVCLWNRDFNNAVWVDVGTPTTTQDNTGVDGILNTAWTLTDNSGVAAEAVMQTITIPDDSSTYSSHIYIKQEDDITSFPEIQLDLINGVRQAVGTQVNKSTGAIVNRLVIGTVSSAVNSITINGSQWWKLTQTVQNNSSGNTSLLLTIYQAVSTVFGTVEVGATGSLIVDAPQIELNQSTTEGIIFTTDKQVTHIPSIGKLIEPQRTNKCTNYNANPDSGLINVAKSGDVAATLTRVLDVSELALVGLDSICTSGYVLKLDNSGGATTAYFHNNLGVTSNLNKHSVSVWARKTAGNCYLQLSQGGIGQIPIVTDGFVYYSSSDLTPSTTINEIHIQADAGGVVYFILNQLEEGTNATSIIETQGSAVTRNGDQLSYSTVGIPNNDCVFSFDWTPTAETQAVPVIWSTGDISGDRVAVYESGSGILYMAKRLGGTDYNASTPISYSTGVTYNIKGRLDSVFGVDIWLDNVKGGNNSNTTDAIHGASLKIGSHWDYGLTNTGSINNFTTHKGTFTDEEVVAL